MLIHEECAGFDELFATSFGEVTSSRILFGPGVKCTRALKCESQTGQFVAEKES